MLSLNHKNLDVWKNAIDFVAKIYRITEGFPKEEVYSITNQLRRAAVSVPSNIAEGASRKSTKDRKRFYEIARSSLVELDTQLEISIRLDYISGDQITELTKILNHLFAMLSNLVIKTR